MGLVIDYRKFDLAPFVRSLRDGGYSDEIGLYVCDLDSGPANFLKRLAT